MSLRTAIATIALIGCISPISARAGSIFRDFNLVTIGDLTSDQDIEGRALIGGNLVGNNVSSNFAIKLVPSSAYSDVDTLVIGGNLAVGPGGNINLTAGDLRAGGSQVSGNVNLNGVGSQAFFNDPRVLEVVSNIASELTSTSESLRQMTSNSSVSIPSGQPGPMTFIATPGSDGVAVFDIDGAVFSNNKIQQIDLILNGASSLVINVSGTAIQYNTGNFVGSWLSESVRANTIWNFDEAATIALDRNFHGAILAPEALLTNSTAIDGSVFVRTMIGNGEVHLPNYSGYLPPPALVPEPTSLALCGLAVPVGILLVRRRGYQQARSRRLSLPE